MICVRRKYYLALILALIWVSKSSFSAVSTQNVLYINSYHNGYYWSDGITEGIKTTFRDFTDINLSIEYLDSKRDRAFLNDTLCLQLFIRKYKPDDIDLIITSDNDALDFVKANKDLPLFSGKPIVACGITDPENYITIPKLYAVKETTAFEETFELMQLFIPNLDTIFFITDRTKSGLIYEEETRKIVDRRFPNVVLSFIDCIDKNTLGEIVGKINYPSSIFNTSISINCKGKPLNDLEIAEIIGKNANTPLFSGHYVALNEGYVGGGLTTGVQTGKMTSTIALQLLSGENIQSIKTLTIPEIINIFDFRTLQKYNIPESLIPAGSVILNKPESFWAKNKKVLIISGIIIIQLLLVIIILYRNILIQKRYRKQIILAMEKANESDRLKSIFLENVSHEMRTPLNSIVGFSDVLTELMEDNKLKDYIKIISDNALSLNHTINNVFDFSLLKTHSIELNLRKVNLNTLLSKVIDMIIIEKKYDEKPIRIIKEPDPENVDLEIFSDENKIYQVIKHLTDNAFKYTLEGGIRLGFSLKHEIGKSIPQKLKRKLKPPFVLFHIIDTGKGINPEYFDLIFEPFRQADEKDVNANRGLGLGLSISKSIIELLGGFIWVESQPNKGSSFYFVLPIETVENVLSTPSFLKKTK